MTAMTTHPRQARAEPRPLVMAGVLAYRQVAALLAAFGLIALLSHFFDFQWRCFVATLVAQWHEYVRPVTKWLLNLLVTTPLGWFGWRVELPYRECDQPDPQAS